MATKQNCHIYHTQGNGEGASESRRAPIRAPSAVPGREMSVAPGRGCEMTRARVFAWPQADGSNSSVCYRTLAFTCDIFTVWLL